MKFTHRLFTTKGWEETNYSPSDYEEVKHLGECPEDGDMFAGYDIDGYIHIFKGVLKEELKKDTWYKHKDSSLLVFRTGSQENYGIKDNKEGECFCSEPENWQEATNEEVKEALVKLAKKKGFKNIGELKIKDAEENVFEKGRFETLHNKFRFEADSLFLDGVEIFQDGKWAEIIEEEKQPLTILDIEHRLKRLEDKINGND